MKKLSLSQFTLVLLAFTLFYSCEPRKKKPPVFNPEFANYIAAYTSGVISISSGIKIVLVKEIDSASYTVGDIPGKIFRFSPEISGKSKWLDHRTIVFEPDENIKSGELYDVKFDLGNFIDVSEELSIFEFQFQTIKMSFELYHELEPDRNNRTLVSLKGSVISSDFIENSKVEKIVRAILDNQQMEISWQHKSDGLTHEFNIDNIERKDNSQTVTISWDGKSIGVDDSGRESVEIPPLSEFKVLDVKIKQNPQEIVVMFSDPLDEKQDLQGMIRLKDGTALNTIIQGSRIKAYTDTRETGENELIVGEGVKSIFGSRLKEPYSIIISFEELKPQVEFLGNGVIIPHIDGLHVPFKAVNLKAVDVELIKIFESNIGQFLQVNNIGGHSDLRRVGRPVFRKKIDLDSDKSLDMGQWNVFSLELTDLIQKEPGAIYRINFSFRQQYSLYNCGEESVDGDEDDPEENAWDDPGPESSYWDDAGYYYYYYYPPGFNWSERDNPCDISYYNEDHFPSRNILSSDLGIIAKEGAGNIMNIVVTDIITTEPIPGASIELFNFQHQIVGKAQTNSQGIARIDLNSKPFLLKAIKGKQVGYLRVDDGTSLSLSKFDVSGVEVKEGVKGYIYGERGVWRPGDSLYLTFILEQKDTQIPQNHPVTFELINPRNQIIERIVKTKGQNGFYDFRTATDPDALTGNWTAKVKIGGALFTKRIKIETVKPNRLKIKLDFGTQMISVKDRETKAHLNVSWLTGATAGNLKATIDMMLTQTRTKFKGYDNYEFDDPSKQFYDVEDNVFDGRVNDLGNAVFNINMPVARSAPGMVKASFSTKAFEESGEFSIDYTSIDYAPYSSFVGLMLPEGDHRGMLLTDTTHTVDIVTVDPDGKAVSINNLSVKVYKVEWRWWWNASDDDLASYFGRTYREAVIDETISTVNGKGEFNFRIEYPSWGRYFIHIKDNQSGHSTGKTCYIDWPGWAGTPKRSDPQSATMLVFSADKEKYEVGDNCVISFPSGGAGRALVSIESGSDVIETFWIQAMDKQTEFSFEVKPEMTPNVYVNITFVQPYEKTNNDTPIRLYGVIPVMVEDPQTILYPEIEMPDVLKPEEKVTIKISEKNNRPMTYTIAVVDEGLLDLTHFKTPDPWKSFYSREALGVKSWDMYEYVLGAYGGTIEQMFAVGGGADEKPDAAKQANRFKPVVEFLGPYYLNRGSQLHTFKMPNYVGSVRTMVVAGNNQAFGSADKTTPVKQPLMILATLPRVLAPEEQVTLPVTVFAMEKKVKSVDIEVEVNDLFELETASRGIKFTSTGDQVINFDLKVKEAIGIGKVTVTASSGSETSSYSIELNVRNPNPPVTRIISDVIEAGKSSESAYTMPGISGTNKGVLEISALPPMNLEKRLQFLIKYPYGCGEQTTSAVFPQLYLDKLMELRQSQKIRINKNIKSGIARLKAMQLSNGGMVYWPGGSYANDWLTSYVGHFMLEAEKQGYSLPIGFKENWVNYQKRASDQWSPYAEDYHGYYRQRDMVQAYRLFTLSLAGNPVIGAMNRLKETANLSIQARWLLAAAYVMIGQPEVSKGITADLGSNIEKYTAMSETWGSSLRDRAIILYTLSLMDDRNKGLPLLKEISKRLNTDSWYSTQTTAFCLVAVSTFTSGSEAGSKKLNFEYQVNSNEKKPVNSIVPLYQADLPEEPANGNVQVTNTSDAIIYSTITLTGVPATGEMTTSENNLGLTIKYIDMKGNPVNVKQLLQGTDFMAKVTISNPGLIGTYKDLALTQIFPSGWEITNMRLADFENAYTVDQPTYQDIRDDRVYTFFDLKGGEKSTFVVLLNATYLGKFYLPGIQCEAMYDNSINATIAGGWVEVVEPWE